MVRIRVTKRNGRVEELDLSKIKKYTNRAVDGLQNVSISELELDAKIQFKDLISTEEIQQTLIKTAVEKIDIDSPDWTYVAARLFLYDLYHKVTGTSTYNHLRDYFKRGVAAGRIIDGLAQKYDLDELNAYIRPERDLQFTYMGIKTMHDRYILKDKDNKPIELPQQVFMAIAMFLAQNETDRVYYAKQFYDLLSKFEVMCATPTLSNARTARHQLSSCYVSSVPDNIEGIFDVYKESAILSKFGGGVGLDWSQVRAIGSSIDNNKNAAGGIIPFLKITNDICVAVDQLGTRKGAIATYIEPWHLDVEDFLDLRKNAGEERRRTHEIFPALWINDLFMKRVLNDEYWTLFDPYSASDLTNLYGEEFEKRYEEYENKDEILKEKVRAKELWRKILISYFESGMPFLCFKDNANHRNPNSHAGIIRSSNLCTEIFQNTSPNHYKIKVIFKDGSIKLYEENDIVCGKKASKLTALDVIDDKMVYVVEKEAILGQTAVCNLASINLSKIYTQEEHFEFIDKLMENVSYEAILASSNLAVERGVYPLFEGSRWSKGEMPIDSANKEAIALTNGGIFNTGRDWDYLREKVKRDGMRNGYLMAVAPTSSISILVGTTQTIEPVYKRKWFESNLSGMIPVVVPNLNVETYNYYVSAYDIDQSLIIKAGAIRQKWLDQGQSLNLFIKLKGSSGRMLHELYTLAWRLGLKSTYYLRSESPDSNDVNDRSIECYNCQ